MKSKNKLEEVGKVMEERLDKVQKEAAAMEMENKMLKGERDLAEKAFMESTNKSDIPIRVRVHQRKFLKMLESLRSKKKGNGTNKKNGGVRSEKEGERVGTFVKCKQEVGKIYDIPLCISNEELIGKLLHVEKTKLKSKLEELEKVMEERLEEVQKEAAAKEMENKRLMMDLEKTEEFDSFIDKSKRGILVPQTVVFIRILKKNWKSYSMRNLRNAKVFSNAEIKVARGIGEGAVCFGTSAVFTAGKKFYFQVSANVGDGLGMKFGIMRGELTRRHIGTGYRGKNFWYYDCNPGETPKRTCHNWESSYGYGPERTYGKHNFGIFCDFTEGKEEVSFIVDGKNWGVAYRNVGPPVSPAFFTFREGDWFKIEDSYEVPDFV